MPMAADLALAYLRRDDSEENQRAYSIVHAALRNDPDQAWDVLMAAVGAARSLDDLGYLAAGLFEEFASYWNARFEDDMLAKGREDARWAFMFSRARGPEPEFLLSGVSMVWPDLALAAKARIQAETPNSSTISSRLTDLGMGGWRVRLVSSSTHLSLELTEETSTTSSSASVRIAGAFTFTDVTGKHYSLVGDGMSGDRTSLGVCLNLFTATITAVTYDDGGTLVVTGTGGSGGPGAWRIEAAPDHEYECWEIRLPQGGLIVCTPGGGVDAFG